MQDMIDGEMKLSPNGNGFIVIGNGAVNIYWIFNFYYEGKLIRWSEEDLAKRRIIIGCNYPRIHWGNKPGPVAGSLPVLQQFA